MRDREKKISMPRHEMRQKWDMVHEDKRRAKKIRDDSRYYLDFLDEEDEDTEEQFVGLLDEDNDER